MSDDYEFDVNAEAEYEAVLQEQEGANAQVEEEEFYEDGPNAADAGDQDGEINPYDPPECISLIPAWFATEPMDASLSELVMNGIPRSPANVKHFQAVQFLRPIVSKSYEGVRPNDLQRANENVVSMHA